MTVPLANIWGIFTPENYTGGQIRSFVSLNARIWSINLKVNVQLIQSRQIFSFHLTSMRYENVTEDIFTSSNLIARSNIICFINEELDVMLAS